MDLPLFILMVMGAYSFGQSEVSSESDRVDKVEFWLDVEKEDRDILENTIFI